MHNIPLTQHQITEDYISIFDETDDIDLPSDYQYFKDKVEKKKSNRLKNCISIIIPCYNNAENTKKIINHLLEQKKWYPETEIIVVENGSTEDMSFLDEYDKNLIIVLHETIKGPSHARNAGIKKARGEYITFIDNDDDIAPNYIHLLYRRMRFNNSQYDYCVIPALVDGQHITDYSKIDITKPLTKLLGVWHYCFNRRLIENIYFNENLMVGEDIDWLNKVIPNDKINNGTIIENNTPIYYYK
jgi:glycosyltransferase involved in cell wall biosynthesis